MGWFNSPQYLKGIQKIKAMDPEKKAVTQTLVDELSSLYAGADMQKQLQSMRLAADIKQKDRAHELSQKQFDLSTKFRQSDLDMRKDAQEYMIDEADTAQNLGWANIGLAGLSGYGNLVNKKKEAKRIRKLEERAYGS